MFHLFFFHLKIRASENSTEFQNKTREKISFCVEEKQIFHYLCDWKFNFPCFNKNLEYCEIVFYLCLINGNLEDIFRQFLMSASIFGEGFISKLRFALSRYLKENCKNSKCIVQFRFRRLFIELVWKNPIQIFVVSLWNSDCWLWSLSQWSGRTFAELIS